MNEVDELLKNNHLSYDVILFDKCCKVKGGLFVIDKYTFWGRGCRDFYLSVKLTEEPDSEYKAVYSFSDR
jgi:hypothetical protein